MKRKRHKSIHCLEYSQHVDDVSITQPARNKRKTNLRVKKKKGTPSSKIGD